MLGTEPLKEMQDYVLTIGVKNNSTRATVFENFHVLFKNKTEELVWFLFEILAPQVRQEHKKIEDARAKEEEERAR